MMKIPFTALCAYVLMAIFFVVERLIRSGTSAKDLKKTVYDKRSTNLLAFVIIANVLGILIAPLLNRYQLTSINFLFLSWVGICIMLVGLLLRIIAAYTLGKFYTRTLRKVANHKLITTGVYKYVRHPGYLGILLLFVGGGLAVQSWVSLVLGLILLTVYGYRIRVEEKMLLEIFGQEYRSYVQGTSRLIPFIY